MIPCGQPGSLEQKCIWVISRNEHLWVRTDIGCFVAPVVEKLLEEVLRKVKDNKILWQWFEDSGFFGVRINHVQYQLWNQLSDFNRDPSSLLPQREDVEDGFDKFLQSCKQLTHLDLSTNWGPSFIPERLYGLLTGCDLSNLLVLNLTKIRLREDTLGIIGSCCPKLQELEVEHCRGVNDSSIKLLVKKGSDDQCVLKNLKTLGVRGTNVGVLGIKHVLTMIPTITHIRQGGVLPAALRVLQCGAVAPPFQLQELDVHCLASVFCSEKKPTGFPLDMSAFSNLKVIKISLEYHKELELLKAFHSLQNLDKFQLQIFRIPIFMIRCGGPPRPKQSLDDESDGKVKVIPFEPHVSGLIQHIGNKLKKLDIDLVSQVSFLTIGQSCPNLRSLNVYFRGVKSEMYVSDLQRCFRLVEHVRLRQHEQGARPEDASATECENIFLSLLSPMHRLKYLSIEGITLGSTFISDLKSRNPLSHLEVTNPSFWGLLEK